MKIARKTVETANVLGAWLSELLFLNLSRWEMEGANLAWRAQRGWPWLSRGRLRGGGRGTEHVQYSGRQERSCTFLCLQGLLLYLSQSLDQLVLLSLYPLLLLLRVLSFLLLVLQLVPEGSRGGKRDPTYFMSSKDLYYYLFIIKSVDHSKICHTMTK